MKVFVTAPHGEQEYAAQVVAFLDEHGLQGVAPWLAHDPINLDKPEDQGRAVLIANENIQAIRECGAVVCINNCGDDGRGRHFKTGFAIASDKPVLILGRKTLMQHHLKSITNVPDMPMMLAFLYVLKVTGKLF